MTKAMEQKLTAQKFRVLNFHNIDDSIGEKYFFQS